MSGLYFLKNKWINKKGNSWWLSVIVFSVCFTARTPSSESGTAKRLSLELNTASQHKVAITLKCVCEHLCFIFVYVVHQFPSRGRDLTSVIEAGRHRRKLSSWGLRKLQIFATYKLMVNAFFIFFYLASERIRKNVLYSHNGGNLYIKLGWCKSFQRYFWQNYLFIWIHSLIIQSSKCFF